jgi:hypothetical protein
MERLAVPARGPLTWDGKVFGFVGKGQSMRTYRSACLTGVLAGLLAVSSAHPAIGEVRGIGPAQDTTRMTLIISTFPGTAGAKQALDNMRRDQPAMVGQLKSYGVVAMDQKGNVTVQEQHGKVDGVVALLGKPPSGGAMDSAAANRAGLSAANAEKVRGMLTPGSSAIILMVPAAHASEMDSAMKQAHAQHVMDTPLQPGR